MCQRLRSVAGRLCGVVIPSSTRSLQSQCEAPRPPLRRAARPAGRNRHVAGPDTPHFDIVEAERLRGSTRRPTAITARGSGSFAFHPLRTTYVYSRNHARSSTVRRQPLRVLHFPSSQPSKPHHAPSSTLRGPDFLITLAHEVLGARAVRVSTASRTNEYFRETFHKAPATCFQVSTPAWTPRSSCCSIFGSSSGRKRSGGGDLRPSSPTARSCATSPTHQEIITSANRRPQRGRAEDSSAQALR